MRRRHREDDDDLMMIDGGAQRKRIDKKLTKKLFRILKKTVEPLVIVACNFEEESRDDN